MGSQQSVAGELQGLHEKCVDALAEPKGAEDAPRLRALLGDVLTAIGRLQGGAASDDAEVDETEAASENPDLGNDDEGDEDENEDVDELAPVDADAVIRRGEAWSDPTFPANEASLGLRDDVDEGRGPESRGWAASRGRGAGSSSNTAASSKAHRRLLTWPKAASGTATSFRLSACWLRGRRGFTSSSRRRS